MVELIDYLAALLGCIGFAKSIAHPLYPGDGSDNNVRAGLVPLLLALVDAAWKILPTRSPLFTILRRLKRSGPSPTFSSN